ncbi:MAG: hypothetical protein IJ731_05225 [Eubacterium sp.]|nr:hypothetical protein [Eubacterium sp.]
MSFFKEWSFCVCLTLIISVVFSVFAPKGEMKRIYKIMLSVFIFISFIYPFSDFDSSAFHIDTSSGILEINENSGSAYETEINMKIKEFLIEKGIVGANVSSSVRFNAESSELEIKEVVISIPDEYSSEDVESLVFDELGINSRVVYVGE